jgi:peroxiredoxin
MPTDQPSSRRRVGDRLDPISLETLSHGTLELPARGLVHLQFRRFAGCPVCNLHLRTFSRGLDRLRAADVQTIAFFHSSAAAMRPFQGDLPFPVVPDLERRWYRHFGVERSPFAILHPRVMWSALKGLVLARSNPFAGEGGQRGLPADFLVGPDGRLLAVHYGAHANDHWELEHVIALAGQVTDAIRSSGAGGRLRAPAPPAGR